MRRQLDVAIAAARRLARAGALGGGLLILAAALLVSVDVTLRKLANTTLGGADELSGYALAIGSTWSFAFVLLARGHVRIDALYQHLPRRLAAACDLLALAGLLVFASLIAWHGAGVLAQSWSLGARSNSSLAGPLALPQALWWIGYAGFVVCASLLWLRAAAALLAGDLAEANRLIGARSIEEEAADELASALAARNAGKAAA